MQYSFKSNSISEHGRNATDTSKRSYRGRSLGLCETSILTIFSVAACVNAVKSAISTGISGIISSIAGAIWSSEVRSISSSDELEIIEYCCRIMSCRNPRNVKRFKEILPWTFRFEATRASNYYALFKMSLFYKRFYAHPDGASVTSEFDAYYHGDSRANSRKIIPGLVGRRLTLPICSYDINNKNTRGVS
jgi:hypothetical protein